MLTTSVYCRLVSKVKLAVSLFIQDLYIIECLLLKCRLIFLRVLKVFNEPLGESNTER